MYKKIAAFAKGGYFVYFFSVREAGSLCGKAPPERDEAPQSYDDRLAGVPCRAHLRKRIAMMGESPRWRSRFWRASGKYRGPHNWMPPVDWFTVEPEPPKEQEAPIMKPKSYHRPLLSDS